MWLPWVPHNYILDKCIFQLICLNYSCTETLPIYFNQKMLDIFIENYLKFGYLHLMKMSLFYFIFIMHIIN